MRFYSTLHGTFIPTRTIAHSVWIDFESIGPNSPDDDQIIGTVFLCHRYYADCD